MSDSSSETVTFSEFILSIATNAVVQLGGDAEGDEVPGRVNLPLAAQHINIIEMLKKKTSGNLDQQETELLDSLLYDLRMRYLEVAKEQNRGS